MDNFVEMRPSTCKQLSILKMKANAQKLVISLACIGSQTENLQPFCLHIYDTKGGSLCQAFLAETVEIGNMNCCVTEAMHVLRRKLRED